MSARFALIPFVLFLLGVALCNSAWAQSDPVTTARRASQMLDQAAVSLQAAQHSEKTSARTKALTKTIRAYEEGLSALREALRRGAIRQRAIAARLHDRSDRLSRLLGVLQTIGKTPAPVVMMHPSGALGTARAGMILSDVTPALQEQARDLASQLEQLQALRDIRRQAAQQLTRALSDVQTARSALAKAVADRTQLPASYAQDEAAMQKLLESSETLDRFADALARQGAANIANPADFETAKGALPQPAPGVLLHGFRTADPQGVVRPGQLWGVRAQTLVVAPWPAMVRYAGPVPGHEIVVVLEPAKGYLMILSGLGQSFVRRGDVIEDGGALGLMGGLSPNPDAFVMNAEKGSGGNQQETLYIEMRKDNTPLDPAKWFAAKQGMKLE